ncbi:MAG: hypothetical protein ABI761_04095 [Saprospiraceae bacterium]
MDISKENIKLLLDKYWAGDTSLEEETTLTTYFTTLNNYEEFKAYATLFIFFNEERKQTIDLEDIILSKISMQPAVLKKPEGKVIRMNWQKVSAIAASILVIITLGIGVFQTQLKQKQSLAQLDTFDSPEKALEQTKAALLFLSSRMNKGTNKAAKSISKTETLNILN